MLFRSLGTKKFHYPPALLRWGRPCGHFFTKNPGLGCFWGVFGPILPLFRPKQASVGQNELNTPPKPDFLVKKWPQGHPQRRTGGGEWNFFVPSAHLHTYICRWSSAVSARTHTKVGFYPPPLVTAPYDEHLRRERLLTYVSNKAIARHMGQ